jgi:hypothetical protein
VSRRICSKVDLLPLELLLDSSNLCEGCLHPSRRSTSIISSLATFRCARGINCDKKLGSGLFNGLGPSTLFHLTANSSLLMATDTWIASTIIALHLPYVPDTEITGRLHVGQTRISGTIRQFHQPRIVPDFLRIGRPLKM